MYNSLSAVESAQPDLTLQENAVATAMLRRMGDATIQFVITGEAHRHSLPLLDDAQYEQLVENFREDPRESLAFARESMFAIGHDKRLSETDRRDRLGRYLDAYADLTVKLDNEAYPASRPGIAKKSVPSYIPDGFVDMGGDRTLTPKYRNREMIKVDKAAVLRDYKNELTTMFMFDMGEPGSAQQKQNMSRYLAAAVYRRMPYRDSVNTGGMVNLSSINEGVCRHQALVFQVLAQTAGIQSRVIKSHLKIDDRPAERHSSNMIRIQGQWYVLDVTNPDYVKTSAGNEWQLGIIKADGPPPKNGTKVYSGQRKKSGHTYTYTAHDNMFWRIER